MPRQCNDARAAMPIATRAVHVAKRKTNRSFSVAWLHAQVQVNHGAAAITGDNQPVML
jgi:hypothetical protein